MRKELEVGDAVIWWDENASSRPALITAIHGEQREVDGVMHYPCCNIVFTSGDSSKTDPYGRQIERNTSVPHKHEQTAHGFYWMFPDEEPNPIAVTKN